MFVKNHKRTEEQQKDYIIDIFSKCHSETDTGRLQVYYPILCEQIYIWYRDYLLIDVDKMGLEIARVINRFIKNENISKIPDDKDGFFKYLNTSIKREKADFYREYNEDETIKIPKEKKQKLRQIEDFIRMKESQLGRKLSSDEKLQSVSKWFKKQEYIDLLNSLNVGSISYINKDGGDEIDALNLKAAPVYNSHISNDPINIHIRETDMEIVSEAVKSIIEKKQTRSRDCYRALFTLHCIENYKDFEMLCPVLDNQILDAWYKQGKKIKQYEIYQKYHPNAQKSSAEAMASKNLSEFLNDIEAYLKEKTP